MNFAQFQATKRESDNLSRDTEHFQSDETAKGLIYMDGPFIEIVGNHWSEEAKARGKYHLLIDRDEWITDDLESLERELYKWAEQNQYFD